MPKVFTSKTQKRGETGENIAVFYLERQGFKIIDRNYTVKAGEIDIIGEKDGKLYFFEVKAVTTTVTRENISRVTRTITGIRPEENMHDKKLARLYRAVEIYRIEHPTKAQYWQIDLLCVYFDPDTKNAKVTRIENV